MYDAREPTVEQIGQVLGVSRTTIYRALGSKAFAAAAAAEAEPGRPDPDPGIAPDAGAGGPCHEAGGAGCRLEGQRRRGGSGAAGRYDAWAPRVDRR